MVPQEMFLLDHVKLQARIFLNCNLKNCDKNVLLQKNFMLPT